MFLKGHFPEELYELNHFYTGIEEGKMTPLYELFDDKPLCEKIQRKLPFLFALAEQQASRARRIGMEVGTLREQILIAFSHSFTHLQVRRKQCKFRYPYH